MPSELNKKFASIRNEAEWVSNYEKMKQDGQRQFLKYEQEPFIQKFALKHDEKYIYINFLKHEYRVERTSGKVTWSDDGFVNEKEAGMHEVMTIFDVFCYSEDGCHPSGEFANMHSMSAIKGSSAALGNSFFEKEEQFFDKNIDKLAKACEILGGVKSGKGDVAYQIPLFEFLSFAISFWESDEEFPASLQIFVDKNTLQFMHYETMWYAVSHMLDRIKEEMGNLK